MVQVELASLYAFLAELASDGLIDFKEELEELGSERAAITAIATEMWLREVGDAYDSVDAGGFDEVRACLPVCEPTLWCTIDSAQV